MLSNDSFQQKIEQQVKWRVSPYSRGGVGNPHNKKRIKATESDHFALNSRLDFNPTCRVETRPTVI